MQIRNFLIEHPWIIILIVILALIDAVLKLMALWRSARNNSLAWFVCLGIFNTIGILPLIYLLFFGKKSESPTAV